MLNTHGEDVSTTYSTILADPFFEKRLATFDPHLKLMFDQVRHCWCVLEWALDDSGWNIVLVCKDRDGNPKAPGDWVFDRLWIMRNNCEEKKRMGATNWLNSLKAKAEENTAREKAAVSDDHQAMLREDVLQWRKVRREMKNEPVSDATAGYPKGVH